jgi:hypothetical protein
VVTFSYLLTNDGDVTLDGLHVDSSTFSGTGTLGPIVCPSTTLAPHAQMTCTVSYTLTPADIAAGTVTNSATAAGNPPGSSSVVSSATSTATVAAIPKAASADPAELARTGVDVASGLGLGLAGLSLVGGLLIVALRRREAAARGR